MFCPTALNVEKCARTFSWRKSQSPATFSKDSCTTKFANISLSSVSLVNSFTTFLSNHRHRPALKVSFLPVILGRAGMERYLRIAAELVGNNAAGESLSRLKHAFDQLLLFVDRLDDAVSVLVGKILPAVEQPSGEIERGDVPIDSAEPAARYPAPFHSYPLAVNQRVFLDRQEVKVDLIRDDFPSLRHQGFVEHGVHLVGAQRVEPSLLPFLRGNRPAPASHVFEPAAVSLKDLVRNPVGGMIWRRRGDAERILFFDQFPEAVYTGGFFYCEGELVEVGKKGERPDRQGRRKVALAFDRHTAEPRRGRDRRVKLSFGHQQRPVHARRARIEGRYRN